MTAIILNKRQAAVWIDHREAVIVWLSPEDQEILRIPSHVEWQPRRRSQPSHEVSRGSEANPEDDHRLRWFSQHLLDYYDKVIEALGTPARLLILGPGEAKTELKTRIEAHKGVRPAITTEAADRMTEGQLVRRVSDEFLPGVARVRPGRLESAIEK